MELLDSEGRRQEGKRREARGVRSYEEMKVNRRGSGERGKEGEVEGAK